MTTERVLVLNTKILRGKKRAVVIACIIYKLLSVPQWDSSHNFKRSTGQFHNSMQRSLCTTRMGFISSWSTEKCEHKSDRNAETCKFRLNELIIIGVEWKGLRKRTLGGGNIKTFWHQTHTTLFKVSCGLPQPGFINGAIMCTQVIALPWPMSESLVLDYFLLFLAEIVQKVLKNPWPEVQEA